MLVEAPPVTQQHVIFGANAVVEDEEDEDERPEAREDVPVTSLDLVEELGMGFEGLLARASVVEMESVSANAVRLRDDSRCNISDTSLGRELSKMSQGCP